MRKKTHDYLYIFDAVSQRLCKGFVFATKSQLTGYCYATVDPMLATFRKNHPLTQQWTDNELAALLLEAVEYEYRLAESGQNTYTGRFIQRRLNRFLKDAAKLGWKWHDDISIAGIYLGK